MRYRKGKKVMTPEDRGPWPSRSVESALREVEEAIPALVVSLDKPQEPRSQGDKVLVHGQQSGPDLPALQSVQVGIHPLARKHGHRFAVKEVVVERMRTKDPRPFPAVHHQVGWLRAFEDIAQSCELRVVLRPEGVSQVEDGQYQQGDRRENEEPGARPFPGSFNKETQGLGGKQASYWQRH